MTKNSKSTKKESQSLTGHQVVAEIFGYKTQHITDVLRGRRKDVKGVENEIELYKQFQRAYIKKRQIILGINKK